MVMNYYQNIIDQNKSLFVQLKCFLIFLLFVIPLILITLVIKDYSILLFQLLLFSLGFFLWTFIEYNLHRFWMHDKKNSHLSIVKTHNHHHAHPTEIIVTNIHRFAMGAIMIIILFLSWKFYNYFTVFAGLVSGVIIYFLMHRILHLPIAQKIFRKLCRYHIYHHCKYYNTCFGISVPWWDDILGTVPQNPKLSQKVIEFYFNEHHH
jgi:sterol desaturase/sphingolipid hydroxylase (fatty acid hydroxylase superfamily)